MKSNFCERRVFIVLISILLFSFFLVSAVDISTDNSIIGVDITLPEIPINYSLIPTVNSSDFWDNYDTPADIPVETKWFSWVTETLTFDELEFNDSVKNLFAEEQVVYNASVITTTGGTYTDGDIESVKILGDGVTYNVTEDSGAGGLTININFTGVVNFNTFAMRGLYTGGAGHHIEIQLWRVGVGWEEREEITDQAVFGVTTFPIFIGSDFIDSGLVRVRLFHEQNGITAHNYRLDAIFLGQVTGLQSSGSLGDLTERDMACELLPDVFCKDGSKNATGSFEGDGNNLTGWDYLDITNETSTQTLIITDPSIDYYIGGRKTTDQSALIFQTETLGQASIVEFFPSNDKNDGSVLTSLRIYKEWEITPAPFSEWNFLDFSSQTDGTWDIRTFVEGGDMTEGMLRIWTHGNEGMFDLETDGTISVNNNLSLYGTGFVSGKDREIVWNTTDLVTNGDFATDTSGWTTGGGWGWVPNIALWDSIFRGTSPDVLNQTLDITEGESYNVSFTITEATVLDDSVLTVSLGGDVGTSQTFGGGDEGTYSFVMTAGSDKQLRFAVSWLIIIEELDVWSVDDVSVFALNLSAGNYVEFEEFTLANAYKVKSDVDLKLSTNIIDNSSSRNLYEYFMKGKEDRLFKQVGLMSDEVPQNIVNKIDGVDNIDLYGLCATNYVDIGKLQDENKLMKASLCKLGEVQWC